MFRRSFLLPLLAAFVAPVRALTQFDPADPTSCKIIGDPDIYGPGIRISFYLQWVSLMLAIWLAPETTKNIRISTNIVSLALFINVFRSAHSLVFLEFYLVSWMTIYLLLANMPLTKALLRKSLADVTAMLVLWFMFTCAQVFMYSKGLHVGDRKDCIVWIWAADNKLGHPYANIYEHVAMQLVGAILFMVCLVVLVPYLVFMLFYFDTISMGTYEWNSHEWSIFMKIIVTIANVILGSISIATVENTIHRNNIDLSAAPLLESSGQLIALVMGILSLVTVIWTRFNPFEKSEEEPSKPSPPSQRSSTRQRQNNTMDPEQGQIPLRVLDPALPSEDLERPSLIHHKTA